jgi:hypothetical protein
MAVIRQKAELALELETLLILYQSDWKIGYEKLALISLTAALI